MRLFLAATAAKKELVKEHKPLYVLESFYYVKPWQTVEMHHWKSFLLDSGAFTFMQQAQSKGIDINWNRYMQNYIDFIKFNGIRNFFELDIDSIVGYEDVKQLRHSLEKETGRQCIPVWHRSRGLDEFKRLCQEYSYIAIGGFAIKTIMPKEYPFIKKLIQLAAKYNTKVHGLGFTPQNVLDYGFYSVDSSSWIAGGRYGGVYYFNGRRIIRVPTPKGKRSVDSKIRDEYSLQEWLKYQRYLDMKG